MLANTSWWYSTKGWSLLRSLLIILHSQLLLHMIEVVGVWRSVWCRWDTGRWSGIYISMSVPKISLYTMTVLRKLMYTLPLIHIVPSRKRTHNVISNKIRLEWKSACWCIYKYSSLMHIAMIPLYWREALVLCQKPKV